MKKLLTIGILAQLVIGAVSLVRLPLVVESLGVTGFAGYASALGCWALTSAVGEGTRAYTRRTSASLGPTSFNLKFAYLKALPVVLTSTVVSLAVVSYVNTSFGLIDPSVIGLIFVSSCLYPISSSFVGAYEGAGNYSWFQKSLILIQFTSFLATLGFSSLHSQFALVMSVIFPSFFSGIYAYFRVRKHRQLFVNQDFNAVKSSESPDTRKFVSISMFENFAYSLDTTIVLAIAGPVKAAAFNVMQRVAVLFSMVPTILSPKLAVENSKKYNPRKVRKYQIQQGLVACLIGIPVILLSPWLYSIVTHGKIESDILIVCFAVLNGVIGSWLSPISQALIQPEILNFRAKMAAAYSFCSLALTSVFVYLIGPAGAFLATSVSLASYVFVVQFRASKGSSLEN